MIPRLFEHTSAGWAKYSDYEWRMATDGQNYLMPAAKAEADVYNPMTQADELIVEAVNIGLLQFHKCKGERGNTAICLPIRFAWLDGCDSDYAEVCGLRKGLSAEESVHPAGSYGNDGLFEAVFPVYYAGFLQEGCQISLAGIWR